MSVTECCRNERFLMLKKGTDCKINIYWDPVNFLVLLLFFSVESYDFKYQLEIRIIIVLSKWAVFKNTTKGLKVQIIQRGM